MEVKINREIRNYTESMFFGLSLRQLIFSALAMAVAVGLYFLLEPRELRFESSNLYYDLLKPSIDKWEKEEYKRHD